MGLTLLERIWFADGRCLSKGSRMFWRGIKVCRTNAAQALRILAHRAAPQRPALVFQSCKVFWFGDYRVLYSFLRAAQKSNEKCSLCCINRTIPVKVLANGMNHTIPRCGPSHEMKSTGRLSCVWYELQAQRDGVSLGKDISQIIAIKYGCRVPRPGPFRVIEG
jgi:hypothetical protein